MAFGFGSLFRSTMPKRLSRTLAAFVCVAVVLSLHQTSWAVTEEPARQAACAAFDLHLVIALEEHRRHHAVSQEKLASVFDSINQARVACREGRVQAALAMYEMIDITPGRYGLLR